MTTTITNQRDDVPRPAADPFLHRSARISACKSRYLTHNGPDGPTFFLIGVVVKYNIGVYYRYGRCSIRATPARPARLDR